MQTDNSQHNLIRKKLYCIQVCVNQYGLKVAGGKMNGWNLTARQTHTASTLTHVRMNTSYKFVTPKVPYPGIFVNRAFPSWTCQPSTFYNITQNELKFSGVKRGVRFGDILWELCEWSKYQAKQICIKESVGLVTGMLWGWF